MANSPSIFAFDSAALRVVRYEAGAPWFNAQDLCAVLGFGNPRQAVETHVDEDDVQKLDAIDTIGRTQSVNHVNESGMYALIFGSTKPEAKKFKRWVTSEVLPAIRQTGRFETVPGGPKIPAALVISATNAYANTAKALTKTFGVRQAHVLANAQAVSMGLDLHSIWGLDPATLPDPQAGTQGRQIDKLISHIKKLGGVAKRQTLLRSMHCTASELDALVAEASALGLVQGTTAHGYAGTVYTLVGGAA